jgi:ankyrin repeat protein
MLSVAAAMVVLPFLIVLVLARADYPIFKQLIAPNRPLPNYAVPHSAAQAHVHVSHFDPSIRYVFAQSSPRGNAREPNVAASPKMAAVRDERRVPAQPMAGLWAASGNGVGHSGEMSLSQLQSAVSSGADVNARNTVGETALMWAASTGKLDVVEFLVSHGANVNVADNKGQTALMGAANAGNLDCEAYLMSNGAEINAKDAKGWTPLMNAAISGNLDCVDALIKCGADVNVRSDAGVTAMTCAQYKRSQPEIAALQAAGAAG